MKLTDFFQLSFIRMRLKINSISDLTCGLLVVSAFIAPGSKGAAELETKFKLPGATEFIQHAVYQYCNDHIDQGADKLLIDDIEEIVALGKKKFKPSSEEVQVVIKKVHSLLETYVNLPFLSVRDIMENTVELYADPGYSEFFDKITHGRGAGKYVSAAFQYYCENLSK